MEQNNYRIVVCEKCKNIPKIILLNKSQIQIECQECNETNIKDFSYFQKFLSNNKNDDLFKLSKCTYNVKHKSTAKFYCFQCNKYFCNDCSKIHNSFFNENHKTINQNVSNQYYCKNKEHGEYILDRYCTKCKNYLCPRCKCEHKESYIYYFNSKEININEIKNKIKECEEIIKNEENSLNNFIKIINTKIENLNKLFKDYKERNLNMILIYKLIINNYEQLKEIKNYNIRENILLNNNFDIKMSEFYANECLFSNYNRKCAFYRYQNHIITKQNIKYYINQEYYNKIKKMYYNK